jgi:WD40 repeat protein
MRTNKLIAKSRVHKAAINFLDTSLSGFTITGSADKTVKTFDILNGFKPVSVMNTTDAVFCGEVLQNMIIVGCGDGNVLSFNMDNSECLYGYGADSAGAIHCLAINDDCDCLITGGDSGQALCINFV